MNRVRVSILCCLFAAFAGQPAEAIKRPAPISIPDAGAPKCGGIASAAACKGDGAACGSNEECVSGKCVSGRCDGPKMAQARPRPAAPRPAAKPLPPICEYGAYPDGNRCVCDDRAILVQVPGSRRQGCAAPFDAAQQHVSANIQREEIRDGEKRLRELERVVSILCNGDTTNCQSVRSQIADLRGQLAPPPPGPPGAATASATVNFDLTSINRKFGEIETSVSALTVRVTDVEGALTQLCGRKAKDTWAEQCKDLADFLSTTRLIDLANLDKAIKTGGSRPSGPPPVEIVLGLGATAQSRGGRVAAPGFASTFQINGTGRLTGFLQLRIDLVDVQGINVALGASSGLQFTPSRYVDLRVGGAGSLDLRPGYHQLPLTTLPLWYAGGTGGATVWFSANRRAGVSTDVDVAYGEDDILVDSITGRNIVSRGLVWGIRGILFVRTN